MGKKVNLKLLLYIDIAIILILVFYKICLFAVEGDFQYFNIKNIDTIENNLQEENEKDGNTSNLFFRALENIWIYLHSFFYINLLNFLLILSLLVFLGIIFYHKVSRAVDYYRDFTKSDDEILEKEKLNIAMFTNNYFPFIGGVPISIYRLAGGLRKRGHTVYIFAPKYPQENHEKDKYVIRYNLFTYYKTKIFEFAIVNIFSPKIEKDFVAMDFDIVHVHHPFWMGRKGLSLGLKYNIPVIFTYHTRFDLYYHYIPFFKLLLKNTLSHKIIRRFAQKCQSVFAPSNSAKEYLENIGVSRHIDVIPTGIDFKFYENVTDEEVRCIRESFVNKNEILLCSVSRLSQEKNIYFLIKAINYIKHHTTKPFKCIIIGGGPEKEQIIETIKVLDLQSIIKLVGSVSPEVVSGFYMASDVFVFSSTSETQGMVLFEAMAGRCPVVAVSSSGIEDVIKNDYNGYKTIEDIEQWSEKVIYLMNNEIELRKMSQNAYEFSEDYSIEALALKASKVYSKAIKDNTDFADSHLTWKKRG